MGSGRLPNYPNGDAVNKVLPKATDFIEQVLDAAPELSEKQAAAITAAFTNPTGVDHA